MSFRRKHYPVRSHHWKYLIPETEQLPYTASSQISGQSRNPQLKDRICDNVLPGKGYSRPSVMDTCGIVPEIMISGRKAKKTWRKPCCCITSSSTNLKIQPGLNPGFHRQKSPNLLSYWTAFELILSQLNPVHLHTLSLFKSNFILSTILNLPNHIVQPKC
jgi:hypothetical protein